MTIKTVNKRRAGFLLIGIAASIIVGCATVKGTVMGAGIGYVLGDAEMGASIGATAGLIKDIWD